jgi:hypothetical protein
LLALSALLLATGASEPTRTDLIGAGIGLSLAALLIAAYIGEWGPQRRRPVLTPVIVALIGDHDRWEGSASDFAQALILIATKRGLGRLVGGRRQGRLLRAVGEWREDPNTLELGLLDEESQLRCCGLEAVFSDAEGVRITRRVAAHTSDE